MEYSNHSTEDKKQTTWQIIKKIPQYEITILVFIFLVGIAFFIYGLYLESEEKESYAGHFMVVIATILTLESIASGLNHYIVQRKFIEEVTLKFNAELSKLREEFKAELTLIAVQDYKNVVSAAVKDEVKRLKNFNKVGIIDTFKKFDIESSFKEILALEKCELIQIQRMYFSSYELDAIKKFVPEIIKQKKSKLRILLLSPFEKSTIELRERHNFNEKPEQDLKQRVDSISTLISAQLIELSYLESLYKESIEIKIHTDFVAVSVMTFHSKIIFGTYLQERTSEHGVQIVVEGNETQLGKELVSHFENQWKYANHFSVNDGKIIMLQRHRNRY